MFSEMHGHMHFWLSVLLFLVRVVKSAPHPWTGPSQVPSHLGCGMIPPDTEMPDTPKTFPRMGLLSQVLSFSELFSFSI